MVGVLQADFYLRKFGGLGPTSVRPFVVAGLKASPPKLVLLQGSSEPTVIIGEAASVWSVASKILDEFVSWEVLLVPRAELPRPRPRPTHRAPCRHPLRHYPRRREIPLNHNRRGRILPHRNHP